MRRSAEKREAPLMAGKKLSTHLIPLCAALPIAVLCVVMIAEALHSDGTSYVLPFVDYGGTFKFHDITVLGLSLYKFLMLVGLAVAVFVSLKKRSQYGYKAWSAALVTVLYFLQAYLGAKILFGVEKVISAGSFSAWSMNGQSLFGTLYLSMPVVPLLALLFRKKIADTFDFITPTWLILLTFVRTGCFTAGCCAAKELTINGSPVLLPVQLFEVICDLCILSLCLWLDQPKRRKCNKNLRVFPVLLVTYCSTRFLLEFLRNNDILSLGVTISQIHCVIFFIVGVVWLRCIRGKKARTVENEKKGK